MNKAELLTEIKKHCGADCTNACATNALAAVLEAIKKGVKKDGQVQIIGFGTFKVSKRAARMGVNPQTRAKIKIPATKTVTFKPSSVLKELA